MKQCNAMESCTMFMTFFPYFVILIFFYFYDLDLGSFDYTYDDSDEFVVVCSICVNISYVIHSDCDVGVDSDPSISLPPTINLPLPSTIQPPSLELKPLPEHIKYAFLDDAQKLQSLYLATFHLSMRISCCMF